VALLTLSTPVISVTTPEGWEFGTTPETLAVARGPRSSGFAPNVVVYLDRVEPSKEVAEVATELTSALTDQYANVSTRNTLPSAGRIDQVLLFTVEGINVVRYQRLILVEGSLGAMWLVRLDATCAAVEETDLKPTLVEVLNSLSIS
jgi:hypothetical protein